MLCFFFFLIQNNICCHAKLLSGMENLIQLRDEVPTEGRGTEKRL